MKERNIRDFWLKIISENNCPDGTVSIDSDGDGVDDTCEDKCEDGYVSVDGQCIPDDTIFQSGESDSSQSDLEMLADEMGEEIVGIIDEWVSSLSKSSLPSIEGYGLLLDMFRSASESANETTADVDGKLKSVENFSLFWQKNVIGTSYVPHQVQKAGEEIIETFGTTMRKYGMNVPEPLRSVSDTGSEESGGQNTRTTRSDELMSEGELRSMKLYF